MQVLAQSRLPLILFTAGSVSACQFGWIGTCFCRLFKGQKWRLFRFRGSDLLGTLATCFPPAAKRGNDYVGASLHGPGLAQMVCLQVLTWKTCNQVDWLAIPPHAIPTKAHPSAYLSHFLSSWTSVTVLFWWVTLWLLWSNFGAGPE